MTELIVALLMIVQGEIKEARIQPSMSECLKGKRVAKRQLKPEGSYWDTIKDNYKKENPDIKLMGDKFIGPKDEQ